ncbi:hypothetical protein ABMA28_016435 [Loxostege sticticalis]|uniref:GATA zinc finger domain-containing protein 14-like n=1 Tax=Loxostege sticticalis TaxID=481309 RepID=A0ABD0T8W4_LOXSC
MRKIILFCVLLMVSSKCESHEQRPTLLGGILTGAHQLGSKIQDVLGGLAHGAINVEVNHAHTGYQHQPRPPPPQYAPNNPGYRPGKPPAETIIVVVETDGRPQHNHNHHGHGGPPQRPHHGSGPPNNFNQPNYPNRPGYGYGQQNNGPWNGNNYNQPQNPRPGYGYNPQGQPNYNGNTYNNNGNFNQDSYGRPINTENYGPKPNNFNNVDFNQNNNGQPPANNGNYNQNNYNNKPPTNDNFGQNYGTKPPTFNNGNSNQNHYGNIPNSPPPLFEKPKDGFQDQNKPGFDISTTTKQPEKTPHYGSVYDVNKENTNNIPTIKPETNVNNNEHTTKKADDDSPLFVPLNPNQYQYGGDKIDVNAPKRETNPKPAEDDDESYPIDIRFGDK